MKEWMRKGIKKEMDEVRYGRRMDEGSSRWRKHR
jgi:hypothetical protein